MDVQYRARGRGGAVTDVLSLAVWGVDYWLSERAPVDELVIRWAMDAHPCDGQPYVVGLEFVESL